MTSAARTAMNSGASVLLVEEDLADLLYLESILKDSGTTLRRARSGEEALTRLGERDFAVVLLGVQMGGMDGFQTAREIRCRPRCRHTPIIFLTTSHSKEFPILDAYKLGAVDYLVKPFVPEVLRAKVKALVDVHNKTEQVRQQADQLRQLEKNAFEQKLREQQQHWEMERLRQEAAADRKIAEALREADRRKDEFLATLAHELRNPLAPIRNAVYIVKHPQTEVTTRQQAQDMIERQVQHMARLLDDLLDVSRIGQGKIELRTEPFDVAVLAQRAVEAMRGLIDTKQQLLKLLLPDEPCWVMGDPTRLEQVLTNIINNACKYTDVGGQISVTVEPLSTEVVLRVQDTGIGIAPELLPRIFDPFVQGGGHSGRSESGLGIGLTLAKKLAELHGGKIVARSQGIGAGSELTVRLPRLRQELTSTTEPAVATPAEKVPARRILVVDDNEDAATSLAALLRLKGHDVRVAFSGPTALQTALSFRPQVVFLDIGMPSMDGYEVAARFRDQPHGKDVMLVAVSGWGQPNDRQRSQSAGFDDHLVKPVEPAVLERLIGQS